MAKTVEIPEEDIKRALEILDDLKELLAHPEETQK